MQPVSLNRHDYDGFSEEARVKNLALDPAVFPGAALQQNDENLGRLTVTTTRGADPETDLHDEIYAFGGRSFVGRRQRGERHNNPVPHRAGPAVGRRRIRAPRPARDPRRSARPASRTSGWPGGHRGRRDR
ncbi:hypothetical protein [Thiocapsa sp.]|uniref:choice-of-anchor I domain-containing protein n=1 Tax=Thiocapsa sp. TaxID=2024551 RepID=UPI0035930B7D